MTDAIGTLAVDAVSNNATLMALLQLLARPTTACFRVQRPSLRILTMFSCI